MTDTITVLKCVDGRLAAKQRTPEGKVEGAKHPAVFDVKSYPVTSLAELAILLDHLRTRPDMLVIRGQLKQGTPNRGIARKALPPGATFDAAPRRWVMLDIDEREDPDGTFATHPHVHADALRSEMPDALAKAACYWHASGSAGFSPGVKLHMWFWLDRAVSDATWKTWVKGWPFKVDVALFRAVQEHYTSDPVLLGVADPMSARSGILPGEPEVKVPPIVAVGARGMQQAEKALRSACAAIHGSAEGERNTALYYATLAVSPYRAALGDRGKLVLTQAAEKAKLGSSEISATIRSAWDKAEEDPSCGADNEWVNGLTQTDKGVFVPTHANVRQVASKHPAMRGCLVWDVRANRPMVFAPPPWDMEMQHGPYPRHLADLDDELATEWFDRKTKMTGISFDVANKGLQAAARLIQVDLFKTWLDDLQYDGVPRLDTWLQGATQSEDSPDYLKFVGSKWLISAVARTMEPGCKVHHALILVGPQAAGKSTMLQELAGKKWFRVMQAKLGGEDAHLQLQGPVIIELAELAAMRGRDTETIKQDITLEMDERRPKYARNLASLNRRCVYAGSTNNDTFLQDTTGNRRFWPVNVGKIDVAWVRAHRAQLWAEAKERYAAKEAWHPTDAETALAQVVQEAAREVDPLEQPLRAFLDAPQDKSTAFHLRVPEKWRPRGQILLIQAQTAVTALGQREGDSSVGRRIAQSFRVLGWTEKVASGVRYFVRPGLSWDEVKGCR